MSAIQSLSNHLLIAMPSLVDPNFSHTVTYLCNHDEQGAMGVVVNRPLNLQLADIADQIDIKFSTNNIAAIPIYNGGPVQTERGFVLHTPQPGWEASLEITNEVTLTMSRDIIEAIMHEEGPENFIITLGYAGWGEGQLEHEIAANAWLNGPADKSILFEKPVAERWKSSAALLGIDISKLSTDVGHA